MTTTIKVHVNGNYRATIVRSQDGELDDPIYVGPGEEKTLRFAHDGKANIYTITEEPFDPKSAAAAPEAQTKGNVG